MSVDSENSCLLVSPRDSRTFQSAEESVLEMLSYSKFSDLETWLCMPSALLLPRTLDFTDLSSDSLDADRSADGAPASLAPPAGKDGGFQSDLPVLTSTVRKRRRLAAAPGGLHWNAAGSVQRDFWSPEAVGGARTAGEAVKRLSQPIGSTCAWTAERPVLRKSVSADDQQRLKPSAGRLDRSRRKLRNIQSLGAAARYENNNKPGVLTQQMQNLQLSQTSPGAAKRLYRNLSEKLRGSAAALEDADRPRKPSSSECIFEAVEQQDLDTVQILLYQFSADELDLNTPNRQGLTPLDMAVMSNNAPIAKLLLKAGARESPHFPSAESREAHLSFLVKEAELRASQLADRAQREGLNLEACRAWEWKTKLYKRMRLAFQQARPPEPPSAVRLSVSSSDTLTVSFQESLNVSVVTKYRVEWSCVKDFSVLAGETLMENLQSNRCIISGLATGRRYFVRVSACNIKGWSRPAPSLPPSAVPSNWRESDGREPRGRGHVEAMERLLQQVRATHAHYCCGDSSKQQNASRKQSVSRSLKHLFDSSSKFVKTLRRGVYLAAVFHHADSLLVTAEEQIPIVEVDDAHGPSLTQDFLWFTKLSCMWEDVRWLRQTSSVSTSSSSVLQARHKMLAAASHMQQLLGTSDLGRVHYEPIRDRHGNVLLVTVREAESRHSLVGGRWVPLGRLQSHRKSLSAEPQALDVLVVTVQDILAFHRRSNQRLAPGLYLGYLKLSSSVDQIRVLVSQRAPGVLCHSRIRDNANVSREEWEWIRALAAPADGSPAPLLYYELQTAVKTLLKLLRLPQQQELRLYSQEVVELGHGVSFLLLLPPADQVCSAPGQSNPFPPSAGFLHLPLPMFELVHFCSYKESFIRLYCRLSAVLDLDALITQQALREAITHSEVATAKQTQQLVQDYIQQLDEMRRDLRWLTDALQSARCKPPRGAVPVSCLVGVATPAHDSTSSNMDSQATPSPELHGDSLLVSDDDASSEVFLPTDSDYDSSEPPGDLSDPSPPSLRLSSLSIEGSAPLRKPPNPPAKRRLLSRSHRGQRFHLRGHGGETLCEGVYRPRPHREAEPRAQEVDSDEQTNAEVLSSTL